MIKLNLYYFQNQSFISIVGSRKFKFILSLFLIILSVFIFALSAIRNYKLTIPYFNSKFDRVCFNAELPKEYKKNVSLLINDEIPLTDKEFPGEFYTDNFNEKNCNSLHVEYQFLVKNLCIEIKGSESEVKNIINNIESVIIFIGDKMYAYNNDEVQNFKTKSSDNGKFLYPPHPESTYWNVYEKSTLNYFVIEFLSVFYEWQNYIIPWILLIVGICLYPRGHVAIKSGVVLGVIFFLGYLFRFNMCTHNPFWFDELNIISIYGANFIDGLGRVFNDIGNPPLVNLIYQIFTRYDNYFELLRMFFVLIGTFGILTVYLLAKDRISKNVGLISAFICAVSLYTISYSQMCRSYIISFTFVPLFTYFLFKVFEKEKLKYYAGLILSGIILINTHLFGLVFLGLNFLYGFDYLCRTKMFNKIRQFIVSFFVIGISVVPYFMITLRKVGVFDENFKSWIVRNTFFDVISYNFGTFWIAVVLAMLCICSVLFRKKLFPDFTEKQNAFFNYLIFFIPIYYVSIFVISTWQNSFSSQYFLIIYGFTVILISIFVEMKYKFLSWMFVLVFICSQIQDTSGWFVHSYRDNDKVIEFETEKKNHFVYNMAQENLAELFDWKNNVLWLTRELYVPDNKYDETELEPIMDRLGNKNSVFLINAYFMHYVDIKKYFGDKADSKYEVSVIMTPLYPLVKISSK